MAAIAIPIVVLGSLYILSEQEKKKENFQEQVQEEHQKEEFLSGKKKEGFSNYQMQKLNNFDNSITQSVDSYNNSNQHTDKFFVPQSNKSNNEITLMNGQVVNPDTFKHNNMQPYFGAKIRGATSDFNNTESILDLKQGCGSQIFSKSEQAPLFKQGENTNT